MTPEELEELRNSPLASKRMMYRDIKARQGDPGAEISATTSNARARAFANAAGRKRDEAALADSPIGQFQQRMEGQAPSMTTGTFMGRQSDVGAMRDKMTGAWDDSAPAYESTGAPRGIPDRSGYATGRVRISGDIPSAYIGEIASEAIDRDRIKEQRPSTYVDPKTGETVVMPRTLSVSAPRAAAFMQYAKEREAMTEQRRQRMLQEERQASVDAETKAEILRRRLMEDEDRKRSFGREDREDAWMLAERNRLAKERSQSGERNRLMRIAEDPKRSPADRSTAERRLAMMDEGYRGQLEAPDLGSSGVAGSVGSMLAGAFKKASVDTDSTFNPDPVAQKRYDAEQKRAGLGLDRAPDIETDEDFRTDKAILKERVAQLADTGFGNANADPAAVSALASEIESIAAKNAERLGGTPEQIKSSIVRDILATGGLPDGVRKQLLAMLTGGEVGGRERSAIGKAMDVTTGMPLTPQWVVRKMLGQ